MALWTTTGVYFVALLIATSLPGEHVPLTAAGSDKTAHLVAYAGLGLLLALSIRSEGARRIQGALLALAIVCAYAILDEWHQQWIPSRSASLGDVVADWIGGLVGVSVVAIFTRRLEAPTDSETPDPADQ